MQQPLPRPKGPTEIKRNLFKEIVGSMVGACLLFGLIWFFVAVYKDSHPSGLPADSTIKTPFGKTDVRIYPYSKNGVTYLVFVYEKDICAVNYTSDSLRLQEYQDYQQMIRDTSEQFIIK